MVEENIEVCHDAEKTFAEKGDRFGALRAIRDMYFEKNVCSFYHRFEVDTDHASRSPPTSGVLRLGLFKETL